MRKIIIESPYRGPTPEATDANVQYARRCMADALARGEAPYASHLLFTQPGILDDTLAIERALGIQAGLVWGEAAEATIVYEDRGISEGMKQGIERAKAEGRPIEYRRLDGRDPSGLLN